MKNKKKILLSAVLTIVLCLSLIAGTTFALFTSESKVNIAVTSGTVDIVATIGDSYQLYSATDVNPYDADPTADNYDVAGTIDEGPHAATYYYKPLESATTFTNGGTAELAGSTLTLTNITPGDKVDLTINIKNNSNVSIKYRTRVDATASTSTELFEALDITIGGADQATKTTVSAWKSWEPTDVNQEELVNVSVALPIAAGNEYQDKSISMSFAVEAVQGNAAWALLDQLNTHLANLPRANNTMYEALYGYTLPGTPSDTVVPGVIGMDVTDLTGTTTTGTVTFNMVKDFIWDSVNDRFTTESAATTDKVNYFKIYDEMPATQTFSIYASESWSATTVADLTVGFDAGNFLGITSIDYNRASATTAQTAIIRTNGGALTINAPLDTVRHYGSTATLDIIAVAGSSYHEYGKVAFAEISTGRMALEEGSDVSRIHFTKTESTDVNLNNEAFNNITISKAENVTMPAFSRDPITIPDDGRLVVALQTGTEDITETTELDYVWLTAVGIYEQVTVSESNATAGDTYATETNAEKQKAAQEIANNITFSDGGNTYAVTATKSGDTWVYTAVDEDNAPATDYTVTVSTNEQSEVIATVTGVADEDVQVTNGVEESDKQEAKDEAVIEEIESLDIYTARVGTTGYSSLQDAIEEAENNAKVYVLADTAESITVTGISGLKIYLNGYTVTGTLTGNNAYALRLYDCSDITIENGSINGQIRIGEHQYTIVKWQYADQYPLHGYHPLAPAENVVFNNLNVTGIADKPIFYFTNIEDDLTRANVSNPVDNDLYGHYIYKTGYETQEQSDYKKYDEVFTALEKTDTVYINGGSYNGGSAVFGNMHKYNNETDLYTDVVTVSGNATFAHDDIGRFIDAEDYLIGNSTSEFAVTTTPAEYTGRINNVYYTYAGGANDAISFANFGETVYIKENADVVKSFGEDESGNPQKLTIVYEADGIAYTGATPSNPVYDIMIDDAEIANGHIFYSKFNPVAAVYNTGRNGAWNDGNKVGEYATLQDAITALPSDGTVVILKDFTVGDEQTYAYGGGNYKCAAGYATRSTIDFNGHMITYTGTGACIISSQQTGYLYFKDSVGGGGITATNNGYCIRKENAKSDNVYFQGGNYIAENKAAVYLNGGTNITISGGSYETKSTSASAVEYGFKVTNLTVSGGRFTTASINKDCVGKSFSSATLTISGGTFSKAPDASYIASGKSAVDNGDGTYTVK